jgi:hypothetical protein
MIQEDVAKLVKATWVDGGIGAIGTANQIHALYVEAGWRSPEEVADLKADRLTYCAYCGEEFPIDADGTPEAVSNHIQNCPKHPIQDYKAEIKRLKERLEKLIATSQEIMKFAQMGDYANGNTDEHGSIDEGRVRAYEVLTILEHQLESDISILREVNNG